MPHDIGIDLGTSSVLIYLRGKGIVLEEPSVVAVDTETGTVKCIGKEAEAMIGRTPPHITTIRPLRDGVISQYDATLKMLQYFLTRTGGIISSYKPRLVICVPSGITEVEERALVDAATQAGASKTYLIEEPIAAALGAGIDIRAPRGNLVVDIGGGTTDIALISMGGVVLSDSVRQGGDSFDESLIRYMRKTFSLAIGERTARNIKTTVGTVFPKGESRSMEVSGRCLTEGLPKTYTITSENTCEAFEEPMIEILDTVCHVIERVPTELLGDISSGGITLTGGGSLLNGMAKRMESATGLPCKLANDPIHCVINGIGTSLSRISDLQDKRDSHRRKK